ncbi:MAG: 50S ribosomal protein L22, partial [Candidatus Electrothrix sp. AR4]|nr:50S ribosomal protein L22 [Candidatus Electrothrix sp. AR4]
METRAVAKYIRISPQKARLVADVVRGKDVETAITTLRFMPKKAARILRKVLESAVANAEQTETIDVDTLYVKEIQINGGPMLKRFRPRAMGR